MRVKRSLSAIIVTIFLGAMPLAVPLAASAQVSVGVGIGFNIGTPPPPLPYYTQPPAPFPNAIWTPGYWAWGPAGYYWVPGTWVQPPSVGLYWTPGYWGYTNGAYAWNAGYWGPQVGFYGGINYGFGYLGTGFVGGFWSGGAFNYNTAVMNVNRTVFTTPIIRRSSTRTSATTVSASRSTAAGAASTRDRRPPRWPPGVTLVRKRQRSGCTSARPRKTVRSQRA